VEPLLLVLLLLSLTQGQGQRQRWRLAVVQLGMLVHHRKLPSRLLLQLLQMLPQVSLQQPAAAAAAEDAEAVLPHAAAVGRGQSRQCCWALPLLLTGLLVWAALPAWTLAGWAQQMGQTLLLQQQAACMQTHSL
jgi:hypothetical protein